MIFFVIKKKTNPDDKIIKLLKIYSVKSEEINKIGQILTAPLSREIYTILINQELNAKEIGKIVYQKESFRLSNLISILNKMVTVGIVIKQKKKQAVSGHLLSFYKALPLILIIPEEYKSKITKSKSLQNVFQRIFNE